MAVFWWIRPATGFLATLLLASLTWLTPTQAQACGGNLTAESGSLKSPNYPSTYPRNRMCVWVINVPTGKRVRLTVTDLYIQGPNYYGVCVYEYLEARDGDRIRSPLLDDSCGHPPSFDVRSFGSTMTVVFRSGNSPAGKGFNASFTADVDETFLLVSGASSSSASQGYLILLDTESASNYIVHPNTMLYSPLALDYDALGGKVYWSEADTVVRGVRVSLLDGSEAKFLKFFENNATVEGLAVDSLSRLLFYTDSGNKVIGMMTLSTNVNHRTIISDNLDKPRAIALDPHNGVIFWTDWGAQARIERAYYNGTGRRPIVTSLLAVVNALAIDRANQLLYWVDGVTNKVEVSDLDGNGRRTLFTTAPNRHLYGLALVKNTLFITQIGNTSLSYITRGTLRQNALLNVTDLFSTAVRLYNIHSYQLDASGANGCGSTNGGCSVFCVPLPGNLSQCMCPDGQMLAADQRRCEFEGGQAPSVPQTAESGCNKTLTAMNGNITSPNFPNEYPSNWYCLYEIVQPAGYRITLNFSVFGIEEDEASGCIYDYVRIYEGTGAGKQTITNRLCGSTRVGSFRSFSNSMTVEFYTDDLLAGVGFKAFFTSDIEEGFFLITASQMLGNEFFGDIYRVDPKTVTNHRIPISTTNPVAVDYDPREQRIYWTENSPVHEIQSAFLNGSDVVTVKTFEPYSMLNGMSLDPLSRLLFYTDAGTRTISMMSMADWSHKTIINSGLEKPRVIVLDTKNGVFFWTDYGTVGKIERANYDGTDRRALVTANNTSPNGLTIDLTARRLYWVDERTSQIGSCGLAGEDRQTLIQLQGTHLLAGLTLWENSLYINDNGAGGLYGRAVFRVQLGPPVGNPSTLLTINKDLNYIHSYHQHPTVTGTNGCGNNNGGCNRTAMCVPLPANSSKCVCPDTFYLAGMSRCEQNSSLTTMVPPTRTTTVSAACNSRNFTEMTGTLTSPGFPGSYSDSSDCVYRITVPPGYRVVLNFTAFDIERSRDGRCSYDFLEIRDGVDSSGRFLGRLCGPVRPLPVKSFTNNVWIRFFTDPNVHFSGFQVSFFSDSDKTFFLLTQSMRTATPAGNIFIMDIETGSNYAIAFRPSLVNPVAVDYDPVQVKIYWTEVDVINVIRSANLDGSNVTTVLDLGTAGTPEGLALDPLSRLLFYTDAGNQEIVMMSLSSWYRKAIISTDLDKPRAIVLDTTNGVLFWTDWGKTPKIERANYDGSQRSTLVNTVLYYVNALAIDVANNRLYWADAGTDRVESVSLNGQDRRPLLTAFGSHSFYGMTIFKDALYLTDHGGVGDTGVDESWLIYLPVNVNDGSRRGNATVFASHPDYLNKLHAYHLHPNDTGPNGCGNNNGGGCSHFCVPLPGNQSKCMCPDDKVYGLAADGKTCLFIANTTPRLSTTTAPAAGNCGGIFTALIGRSINSPNYPNAYPHSSFCAYQIIISAYRIRLNFTDFQLESTATCQYDYVEIHDGVSANRRYLGRYCGKQQPFVVKSFSNSMTVIFVSDSSVSDKGFRAEYTEGTDMAFFLVARASQSMWLNTGWVSVVDAETGFNFTIDFRQRYQPLAIDFDPFTDRVYWTEAGPFDGIRSARLNGSDVRDVIADPQSVIENMALDPLSRLLFFIDSGKVAIGLMSLTTSEPKTIINQELGKPRSIVLDYYNGVMFWSDEQKARIERADYDGGHRQTLVNLAMQNTVSGLALDMKNGKLYWAFTDQIEMVNVDGGDRTTLWDMKQPQHNFHSIALHNGALYIVDQTSISQADSPSQVIRLPLNIGESYSIFFSHPDILYDLHVVNQRPADFEPNGCSLGNNNGGCAKLCLPLPDKRHKCACPDNDILLADGTTCTKSSSWSSSSSSSSSSSAVGGAVGGTLAALIIIAGIVIIVIIMRRRRALSRRSAIASSAPPQPQGVANPVYNLDPDVMGAEGNNFDYQPEDVKHKAYYKLEEGDEHDFGSNNV